MGHFLSIFIAVFALGFGTEIANATPRQCNYDCQGTGTAIKCTSYGNTHCPAGCPASASVSCLANYDFTLNTPKTRVTCSCPSAKADIKADAVSPSLAAPTKVENA